MADRGLRRRVMTAYTTPGHPVAFSAPKRVANHFRISLAKAKEILEHLDPYRLHREYHKPTEYNPIYVHERRDQVQADLIDVSRLKLYNDSVCFLLVLIDVMTKKLWVYPLKTKSARSMVTALTAWTTSLGAAGQAKVLKTDKGTEFTNAQVRALLRQRRIEWQPALGTLKACVAERVNKTLQILLFKYLTENETFRYLDKLEAMVQTYNTRPHTSLAGMTPEEADRPANQARLQAVFHEKYAKVAGTRRRKVKFAVGDIVRVKTLSKKISPTNRSYAHQFTKEFFTVTRINRTLPIPLYYIRSMDTNDDIDGGFYAEELQRQRVDDDEWKVERVLARRTVRGVRMVKVKWMHFSPAHNSWVREADITRRY